MRPAAASGAKTATSNPARGLARPVWITALAALLTVGASAPAAAQSPPGTLDLDRAIQLALDQNRRLAVDALNTRSAQFGVRRAESEFEQIKANPGLQPALVAPRSGVYIVFNHSAPWSSDINFRQAVLAALEMEPVLAAAKEGVEELQGYSPMYG